MGVNESAFCRTADEVYCDIYQKLKTFGENVFGRNGQTKELTHVCMSISDPTQRWVERRKPAISPAFAIAELVMIMNGSDEAALLNAWNPALPKYQGKYDRYPGAYGKRLRYSFGFDQINRAYDVLKNNPESRQVVMEIWKPDIDLPHSAGIPNNDDIPCNICSLLKIRNELKKYYNPKVIKFFFKLNDTELNKQLREIAFYHLQSFNYQPRLRRQKYMQVHTKRKKRKEYLKKVYPYETYSIPHNPDELEYRIENGKEQKIKSYDYFISHSSKDSKLVQDIITYENSIGKNIFCDWINDSDYLKRNLLCEATLKVIEWRLQQSKAIIFLRTHNSIESVWCKYELNYFAELNKPIYYLDEDKAKSGDFALLKYDMEEFVDPNYKKLALM